MIKIVNKYSKKIEKLYVEIIIDKIERKYKKNRPSLPRVNQLFEDEFGKFSYSKIEDLLLNIKFIENPLKYNEKENDEIKKILDYNSIRSTTKKEKSLFGEAGIKSALIDDLGITVCPYCNRQYINSYYDDNNHKKVTADIDHFRPKSIYPHLALSLYNFIPSCSICNSRLKQDYEREILYPYVEGFEDDCHFKINNIANSSSEELLKILRGYSSKEARLELAINSNCDKKRRKKIENNKKVFKLEKIYQIHTKRALSERLKKNIFDRDSYYETIKSKVPNLSRLEFENLLFGYTINDNSDVPLSKLLLDIREESN